MKVAHSWLGFAALLACGALISGCVESEHPLSEKDASTPDLRLLGDWKQLNPDSKEVQSFKISGDPDCENQLLLISQSSENHSYNKCILLCTKIGNKDYVSAGITDGNGHQRFFLFRYEIRAEAFLGIWEPDFEFFQHAVASKELGGQQFWSFVTLLQDSDRNLREFIEQHSERCFKGNSTSGYPAVVYQRVSN